MPCYRPEQWDKPADELLAYLDETNLRPAFDYIIECAETYWRMFDEHELGKLTADELDESWQHSIDFNWIRFARGAYDALQRLLDRRHRRMLIDFVKYSVLY